MTFDFIIAGGGPAGSIAAYCLQKRGAKCLIVEKKSRITEKTCGGLLTWSGVSALESIGLEPGELLRKGADNIQKFVYCDRDGSVTHRYHAGEYGLGVTRRLLDQWLLHHAVNAGAEWMPGVDFKCGLIENGLFKVGNASAKHLVIATGAVGHVPKGIATAIKDQTFGLSAQITGKTALPNDTVHFFMTGVNDHDYFWIIPNGNHIWNIGIWFQKVPRDAAALFWKYKSSIVDRHFENIQFVRPVRGAYCGNIDFSAHYPPGCYAIGDAAGLNNSTTGEGLRYAIESAIKLSKQYNWE